MHVIQTFTASLVITLEIFTRENLSWSHIAFPKGLSFRCDVNGSSCDRRVEGAASPIEISEKLNFISNSQISSSYNGCYTKN